MAPQVRTLVEHLLLQGAPRAAARLLLQEHGGRGAPELPPDLLEPYRESLLRALSEEEEATLRPGRHEPCAVEDFTVDVACVRLVDGPAAAAVCARVLRRRLGLQGAGAQAAAEDLGPGLGRATAWLALDAEWRPDGGGTNHPPSLLQLALRPAAGHGGETEEVADDEEAVDVWLLDMEALFGGGCGAPAAESGAEPAATAEPAAELAAVLGEALASPSVALLGFSLGRDFQKLALLGDRWPCFRGAVRCVVDLRDACVAAAGGPQQSLGLAGQLRRWAGRGLDKGMQCSDWSRRPLSAAQLRYAAADVACLLPLLDALERACPGAAVAADWPAADWPDAGAASAGVSRCASGPPAAAAAATLPVAGGSQVDALEISAAALTLVREVVAAAPPAELTGSGTAACRLVSAAEAAGFAADRTEVNSLCFIVSPASSKKPSGRQKAVDASQHRYTHPRPSRCEHPFLLVLVPASATVDVRWLSNWLGVARRRMRMASTEECVMHFGAAPGSVPPLPLRPGVHILAFPGLLAGADDDGVRRGLVASVGHRGYRLLIDAPATTLPQLAVAALGRLAAASGSQAAAGGSPAPPAFEWLPDPGCCLHSLDEAVLHCADLARRRREGSGGASASAAVPGAAVVEGPSGLRCVPLAQPRASEGAAASATTASGEPEAKDLATTATSRRLIEAAAGAAAGATCDTGGGGGDADEVFALRAITEAALGPLARKLRMVGIDCEIAGEFVRADQPGIQGLLRVKVDTAEQDAALRRAAALGRLIIVLPHKAPEAVPGVHYRLQASDADEQFAELLRVFGLQVLVDEGESRCGICNGRRWELLSREEVVDHVPAGVLENESEFYQCGVCKQIFWEGEKYTNSMDSLKAVLRPA